MEPEVLTSGWPWSRWRDLVTSAGHEMQVLSLRQDNKRTKLITVRTKFITIQYFAFAINKAGQHTGPSSIAMLVILYRNE